jgi:Uma2 family endonuclease
MAVQVEDEVEESQARRRLFNVHEYHRMGEAGILRDGERTELIEGEIFEMAAIGGPHAGYVIQLTNLLARILPNELLVSPQNPVRLSNLSEPQPDLAVLRRPPARGREVPMFDEVLLLIEVSDTSLRFDRERKLPLYAVAGIPEVWIVDVQADEVEVYWEPAGAAYHKTATFGKGDTIRSVSMPEVELEVAGIIP